MVRFFRKFQFRAYPLPFGLLVVVGIWVHFGLFLVAYGLRRLTGRGRRERPYRGPGNPLLEGRSHTCHQGHREGQALSRDRAARAGRRCRPPDPHPDNARSLWPGRPLAIRRADLTRSSTLGATRRHRADLSSRKLHADTARPRCLSGPRLLVRDGGGDPRNQWTRYLRQVFVLSI